MHAQRPSLAVTELELGCIRIYPLMLDRDSRRVFVHDTEVALSQLQFDLLEAFMDRPRRVLDRQTIKLIGWQGFCSERAVEDAISRLRARVAAAGGPNIVESVRGVGYRLGLSCPPIHRDRH